MDIIKSLKNIIISKSSIFACTHFYINEDINIDIITGDFRFTNLFLDPFNLLKPLSLLDDSYQSNKEGYNKKKIAIWKTEDIKKFYYKNLYLN